MSRIADFKIKYARTVFAIYPACWEQGLVGWGIVNRDAELFGGEQNVPIVHRTGVLKLFSTPWDAKGMESVCEKFITIWRHDFGYSKEPAVLVIEKPHIVDPSIFIGMLMCSLSPALTLVPTKVEWSGINKKPDTKTDIENIVTNINDYHSKRVLKRDLDMIALHNRHQVYDALSIGIYGAEVDLGLKPMPKLFNRAAP